MRYADLVTVFYDGRNVTLAVQCGAERFEFILASNRVAGLLAGLGRVLEDIVNRR